jgi:hypothetical protein
VTTNPHRPNYFKLDFFNGIRRKVQVEIDRTIRTQQELEAAKAKIANLEALSSDRRRWWTRS